MADKQPNRALTGAELRQVILNDVTDILNGDGMMGSHIAYRRVSYLVTIKVMTDNPMLPDGSWTIKTKSKKSTPQQIEESASMEAVEVHPLAGERTEHHLDLGAERKRVVESPNVTRINNGLPVTITARGSDGETKELQATYEPNMFIEGALNDENVTQRALTDEEIAADA